MYTLQVLTAILCDYLFGDPRLPFHPVRLIGALCQRAEGYFRGVAGGPAAAGRLTVLSVLLISALTVALVFSVLVQISSLLASVLAVLLLYTTVAARDLARHSGAVHRRLAAGDLEGARQAVAMIVGRDVNRLDRQGVCRAAVETVAENTVDGVTAPLFWGIVCSLPAAALAVDPIILTAGGAILYKAVNTMDSLFGYKNEKYLHFGRTAARLDDCANYLPARLTPLCMIVAAVLLHLDWRGALRVYGRDRRRHASPNAGHPEAAVAGALGVRLGGPSVYFGEVVDKPYLGDDLRDIAMEDILRANSLMYLGALLFAAFLLVGRALLTGMV